MLSLSVNGTILSSITAAIETPTVFETLGFIKISATVGNARLILKDTDQVGINVMNNVCGSFNTFVCFSGHFNFLIKLLIYL